MQAIDPQKAARVWSRVRGKENEVHLPELAEQEELAAATYVTLARRFQGRDSQLLRQLARQEQDHAACLRGLHTLLTGSRTAARTPMAPKEDTQTLLRRSYGSHMQRLARYEERAADPDYGQIFAHLAAQERAQCQSLLAIIGRSKK